MDSFTPQKEKALIAARCPPGDGKIILKLSPRKNLQGGCILTRPCFCQLSSAASNSACPVHFLWKRISDRVPSGRSLFPSYTRRNINPVLKRICGEIGLPNASRYISHAFRRGAAQELKEKGAQRSTIATLGDWRPLAFRGYVDIANDIARDTSKLLAGEVAMASGDGAEVPLWVKLSNLPSTPFQGPAYLGCWGFHTASQ